MQFTQTNPCQHCCHFQSTPLSAQQSCHSTCTRTSFLFLHVPARDYWSQWYFARERTGSGPYYSFLIWLGRTNQREDSQKKPASLGFSGGKQASDKLCLQSTVWFSWTAICFPMVIEMEQFSSNSLPSLTSLTFMDWPPKFLEAEIQVPLASAQ